MDRLELSEWIEYVPSNIGEQSHTFHCKEGKGNDKLYVKRVDNGAVAFCHHCGKRGYASNRTLESGGAGKAYGTPYSRVATSARHEYSPSVKAGYVKGGDKPDDIKSSLSFPYDASNQVSRWGSVDAKVWVLKYGLDMAAINTAGICWSDKFSSILFPRYLDGNLVAFQTRKFPAGDGPKYLSYGDSNSPYDALQGPEGGSTVVLVEDMLSALKVSQIASACHLGGTSMKEPLMKHLLQKYNKFIIMLDNDNWQVRTNQIKLLRKLSTYAQAYIVPIDKDPKEFAISELRMLLEEYL
jgi:hypothetical protein